MYFRIYLILAVSFCFAAEKEIVQKDEVKQQPSNIIVNYSEDSVPEEQFRYGLGRLFKDSPLSSGLATGSAFLNRTLDSFMEILIYRLLDQEVDFALDRHSKFRAGFSRDLYDSPFGHSVIVDRFYLGPDQTRQLQNSNNITVSLGLDGKLSMYDIYLTSDPIRAQQNQNDNWFDFTVKNWLGFIPFAEYFLPSTFDANQIYNPINVVGTVFSPPTSAGAFYAMPIGVIRSYNISGRIGLPVDLTNRIPKNIRKKLEASENLGPGLGFSVFTEGEFRINVLKRSKNVAWVGLVKTKRAGTDTNLTLGKEFKVLENFIGSSLWEPLPVPFFPLMGSFRTALAKIYNQLYEFDLKYFNARKAYVKAVKGDFTLAHKYHQLNDIKKTGVKYLFSKNETINEYKNTLGPDVIAIKKKDETIQNVSEIELNDPSGRYYRLKAYVEHYHKHLDILSGQEDKSKLAEVFFRVLKYGDQNYKLQKENPYEIDFTLRIQDRFTDAHEYKIYMESIRSLTSLPLTSAPIIPRRDINKIISRRKQIVNTDPSDLHKHIHITPTQLGRFNATTSINFSNKAVNQILSRTNEELEKTMEKIYGAKDKSGKWAQYLLYSPLKLFFINFPDVDFIGDFLTVKQALNKIKRDKRPLYKISHFKELFDVRHPELLVRSFIEMANKNEVARSVRFHTNPKGKSSEETKTKFASLSNKVFRSVRSFPAPDYLRRSEEILRQFEPTQGIIERRKRAEIVKLILEQKNGDIILNIHAKNTSSLSDIYIRIGEDGPLDLVNFMLVEKIVSTRSTTNKAVKEFKILLNNKMTPLKNILYDSALTYDGQFIMRVALKGKKTVWSEYKDVAFLIVNRHLAPL